jgi:hypothetical protein
MVPTGTGPSALSRQRSQALRAAPAASGTQSNIHTVTADGSRRFQVTRGLADSLPDWGPHALAT